MNYLESYGSAEMRVESGEYRLYKEVLCEVLLEIGKKFGFTPTDEELEQFSISVKFWPPFHDSGEALRAIQKKYNLIVLSNIDNDLFEYSVRKLNVSFDKVFTSQRIRAYKPALKNFQYLIKNAGVPTDRILHVAQSIFHDIAPAKKVGLSTVWVNRRKGMKGAGATPAMDVYPANIEVPDLKTLALLTGVL